MFYNCNNNKNKSNEIRNMMRAFSRTKKFFNSTSEVDVIDFITAAIKIGWNTKRDILDKIVEMLGQEKSKLFRLTETLERLTGDDPKKHRWFRDRSGRYHLLH